eukprot:gene33336-44621_t
MANVAERPAEPMTGDEFVRWMESGPEGAHQIINTGTTTMRYLALSTLVDVETCEYPDSQKIMIVAGQRGERNIRKMFRAENTVDYYDRGGRKRDLSPSPRRATPSRATSPGGRPPLNAH